MVFNSEMYLFCKGYITYKGSVVIVSFAEIIDVSVFFEGLIFDKEFVKRLGFFFFLELGD